MTPAGPVPLPPPGPQPTLGTARLVLRPFTADDAPAVQALAGAREIADGTLTVPHPYPIEAATGWIRTHPTQWQGRAGVVYAVTTRDDGALVGAAGLGVNVLHANAELGYWVGVPHWGRGYATEAARPLLDLAFDVLGLHRVQARHFARNPASGRVMQKLGMRFEGVSRGAIRKDGRFEDLAVYALLASDRVADA